MSCQRVYWARCTTHTSWLVCQGAESTWFPVSVPHLLLFGGRSVWRRRQSGQLTWHAFGLRHLWEFGEETAGRCRLPNFLGQKMVEVGGRGWRSGGHISETVCDKLYIMQNLPILALPECWCSHDSSWQRRDCYPGIRWQASLGKSSQASGQGEWLSQGRVDRAQHLGAAAAMGKNVLSIGCSSVTPLYFALNVFSWWPCQWSPGFTSLAETKVALFSLRKDHSSALGFHLSGMGLCFFSLCLSALAPLWLLLARQGFSCWTITQQFTTLVVTIFFKVPRNV